jgi:hypothetical protein
MRSHQNIQNSVRQIIKTACRNQGFYQYELILNWSKIVSPEFAELAQPQKITFYKKGEETIRTLHIEANDSGIAFELMLMKNLIIEKIAAFFGHKYISDLKIVQKFNKEEVVEKIRITSENLIEEDDLLEEIEDAELRIALRNLGGK